VANFPEPPEVIAVLVEVLFIASMFDDADVIDVPLDRMCIFLPRNCEAGGNVITAAALTIVSSVNFTA
jgi:hypothetical protein